MGGAPVTYIQEGAPVTYMQEGAPVTYVDAAGMPVPMPTMMYAVAPQPTRFNISAEEFAQIAQGGSLTQERINELLSSEAVAPLTLPIATTTTATTTAAKSSKKKKVKVSKKKKSGCC